MDKAQKRRFRPEGLLLGALALAAYAVVGMALPVAISRASGPDGLRVHRFGGAGGLCAGQQEGRVPPDHLPRASQAQAPRVLRPARGRARGGRHALRGLPALAACA